ncbi:PAB0415 family putative ATP pyrophosphatase [Athalassotoga saccharophila]|uniref:PAB0415 family putative ATP pyrophosphatase n=1 Tax=Athalassotoga saccharophila TaxID=1441386 RepID=UPI00137A4684|nr:diphthine--ammonia ligase [Athalassotoga saccharophila]BBJ28357.1 hypothetical protein ATHSA_1270 [Athalassotoga saccharophila]
MEYAALFSGGKDGVYAVYLAQREYNVKYLITLKTTIGLSPHYENLSAIDKMARNMNKEIRIFDMANKNFAQFIKSLNVSGIIGGDIYLEEHLKWIEKLAKEAGVKAIEPLWKKDSLSLVKEMINEGFAYSVIAVDKSKLSKEWLGYTFENSKDVDKFVKENPSIDPAGEGGEFHTVVLNCPIFEKGMKLKVDRTCESERYHYLKFDLEVI